VKDFPDALQERLGSGATTLCECWRVTRRDGLRLGFTDHDRRLAFDGTDFEPETGFSPSAAVSALGLKVGGLELAGAFSADAVTEADLEAGLYDGARVECFLVDWTDVSARALSRVAVLGEVTREGNGFVAELRGLASLLDGVRGRFFQPTCDAELGDDRCRVDLSGWRGEGVVARVEGRTVEVTGLARPDGFFDRGALTFTSGGAAGVTLGIEAQTSGRLTLVEEPPGSVRAGDGVRATAGCDKRFETCRDRFANTTNFRGFPAIPGNDFALGVARARTATVASRPGGGK